MDLLVHVVSRALKIRVAFQVMQCLDTVNVLTVCLYYPTSVVISHHSKHVNPKWEHNHLCMKYQTIIDNST